MQNPLHPSLLLLGALLAGCAQQQAPQQPAVALSAQSASRELLTVPAPAGTTAAQLKRQYPGTTLKLLASGQAGFALLERGASPQVPAQARRERAGKTVGLPEHAPRISTVTGEAGGVWMDAGGVWMDAGGVWMDAGGVWMDAGGIVWMDSGSGPTQANNSLSALRQGSGAGTTVALIDGGVELDHPLLSTRLTAGHDYVDQDQTPAEGDPQGHGYGHGTAVAGLIAQMAPEARILPLRVLDSNGEGQADQVAQAIVAAADRGAQVINLSLSTPEDSPAINAAISYATARGARVLAAAGNAGGSLRWPAAGGPVTQRLSAVGTQSEQDATQPASWSSGGLNAEALLPGINLITAYPGHRAAFWSGTSMSTGVASGLTAANPGAVADRF